MAVGVAVGGVSVRLERGVRRRQTHFGMALRGDGQAVWFGGTHCRVGVIGLVREEVALECGVVGRGGCFGTGADAVESLPFACAFVVRRL